MGWLPAARHKALLASLAIAVGAVAAQGQAPDAADAAIDRIWQDEARRAEADARGAAVYARHCAACHGSDMKGLAGAHTPDLTDDYWLFGGDDLDTFQVHPGDVAATIRYGIRSDHASARTASAMPGWSAIAARTEGLTPADMEDVVEYVLHLTGQPGSADAALRGKRLFGGKAACFDCHASDARGDSSIGAPDLTRPAIWLHGTDRAAIRASIVEGRANPMPAFADQLTDQQIEDVSIHVYARAAGYDF